MLGTSKQNNKIRQRLSNVIPENVENDIVSSGVLQSITTHKGLVTLVLEMSPPTYQAEEFSKMLISEVKSCSSFLAPVKDVRIIFTAQRAGQASPFEKKPVTQKPQGHRALHIGNDDAPVMRDFAPGVKHIIAVASGKGGVGKSSVAVNLACALSQLGQSVGLMDADIYGPSQARMMALDGRPETIESDQGKMLRPLEKHGLKVMSMAFMVEENRALIWRGLMIQSAIQQFLRDVDWGELDILIVDMPPGTGDAALTLAQKVPLAGAVIVSTPQDIALIDASRAASMFAKVDTPILGIIENMSVYCCPNCGHQEAIFGQHGAREKARELGVPFLGALPLDKAIREACDNGKPFVTSDPNSPYASAFTEMSRQVLENLHNSDT